MADTYKLKYVNDTLISDLNSTVARKYKSFKWELSGRWNQGSGNSGITRTYMEWDELGIGFDNSAVRYGPTYWTYDSYTLDGTPWAPAERMPEVLLGGSWGTETSKFDASDFVELSVYFHTTDNSAILPTSVGLISTNNQNDYQSSTPLNFKLYGLNEDTNEYELLINVNAANVNKSSTAETIVSSGFTYHYDTVEKTLPIAFTIPDMPSGTYIRTLFFNPSAAESGTFVDSIYNYDLLRITTMPLDPVTNVLAAPNSPFYVEPEWLRNNTVHTQTFGFDNANTITTTGYFIWGDNGLSASPDGMSFLAYKHGDHFRIGGTRWNTTGIPADGATGTYPNYYRTIYQVDGIIYNGNRELLYSGANSVVTANLTKSITGNDYKYIQIKTSVNNNTTDYDGMYIGQVYPIRSNTRDSLSFPYGGNGNWYCAGALYAWSNNYKTLTCTGAKAFMKSLTTTAAMTGNTATPRSNIFAIWGVK